MHADEGSTHHLGNVLDVLSLLGYTETQTPADANLVWAWRDPFFRPADAAAARKLTATHEHLRNLQRYQFVNQLPGQGFLATKPELAKLSARLPRLPRTFQLPQEYKAFKEYVSSDARGRRMEWLQKDPEHRGISILSDPTASALADIRQPVLLQQLVRPMLIQKRLWCVVLCLVSPLLLRSGVALAGGGGQHGCDDANCAFAVCGPESVGLAHEAFMARMLAPFTGLACGLLLLSAQICMQGRGPLRGSDVTGAPAGLRAHRRRAAALLQQRIRPKHHR